MKYWLAILLLLNAAVLAWQWDAFARWGHGPNQERNPERLQQQVRPEALKFELMPPDLSTSETAAEEASGITNALQMEASTPDGATIGPNLVAPAAPATPSSAALPAAPR